MAWPERLQRIFKERGFNLSAVERQIGLGKNRLTQMASGHEPRVTDAVRLCRFLGMPVEEIFQVENGADHERKSRSPSRGSPRKPAPSLLAFELGRGAWKGKASLHLVGKTTMIEPEDWRSQKGFVPLLAPVAAGDPREAHDKGYPAGTADAYVEFACDDLNAFALTVDGASMEPDFRHGDIVIASPKRGHGNNTFRDGMVAVVVFSGERIATIKRVRFGALSKSTEEPMDYKLEPLNPAFPPMRLKTKEIAAVYPVVGLIRRP